MAEDKRKPVCAVVGVGPGNGASLARRFAAEGYAVALLARTTTLSSELAQDLPGSRAYECDVADASSVERAFSGIARPTRSRRTAAPRPRTTMRTASAG